MDSEDLFSDSCFTGIDFGDGINRPDCSTQDDSNHADNAPDTFEFTLGDQTSEVSATSPRTDAVRVKSENTSLETTIVKPELEHTPTLPLVPKLMTPVRSDDDQNQCGLGGGIEIPEDSSTGTDSVGISCVENTGVGVTGNGKSGITDSSRTASDQPSSDAQSGDIPTTAQAEQASTDLHKKDRRRVNYIICNGRVRMEFCSRFTTPFRRGITKFCEHAGTVPEATRWVFEDTRVREDDTPETLGMDNEGENTIWAHVEAVGGSNSMDCTQ